MLSFADRRDRGGVGSVGGSVGGGPRSAAPRQRALELQASGEIDAAARIFGSVCGYGEDGGRATAEATADFAQLLEICGQHERAVAVLRRVFHEGGVAAADNDVYLCELLLLKLLFTRPCPLRRKDLAEMLALIASLDRTHTALSNAGEDTKHGVFKSHWSYFHIIKGLISRERRLPSHLQLWCVVADDKELGELGEPGKQDDTNSAAVPPLYCVGDSHVVSMGHRRIRTRSNGAWRRTIPWVVTGLKAWHVQLGSSYFTGENLRRALAAILVAGDKVTPVECLISAGEIDVREGITHAVESGKYHTVKEAVHHTVKAYVEGIVTLIHDIDPAGARLRVFMFPVLPHARRRGNAGRFKNRQTRRNLQQMWNDELKQELMPVAADGQEGADAQLLFLDISGDFEGAAGPFLRPELSLDDGTHANAKALQIIQRGIIQAVTRFT
jgi:lysophospholipase L1-like esterase